MKQKITLVVLAALFVVASSFAQGKTIGLPLSQKQVNVAAKSDNKNVKQQPSKKMLQMQQNSTKQKGFRAAVTMHEKQMGKDLTKKHQPAALRRASSNVISEQPEGTLVNYTRSGYAYYASFFGVYATEVSGAVGAVVFGADNKVYFKDVASQAGVGTWVEGTISGNKITITLPQTAWDSGEGYCIDVVKMTYDEENQTYVRAADQTVTLNYDATTGAITTPAGNLSTGYDIIGLSYDDDLSWAGYGDWDVTFEKVTDALVEVPAGLTAETYSLTGDGYAGSLVNVGFDGNDVYVQGIDKNLPDNWVKGTVDGNKVKFKSGQYIGADGVIGYHQYLMAATAEEVYDPDWDEYYTTYSLSNADITFEYDATTKTLSESSLFLLNAGKATVNYLYIFDKAEIAPFTEVATTPVAPEVTLSEGGYDYYSSGWGWGSIYFDQKTCDVNGKFTLPEKTSYRLWVKVNGEEKPLTLSWYDYQNQMVETMDEIPYDYADNWDIGTNGDQKYVYYYVIGPEAYGVQTVYRGAGEERVSEISWADVWDIGAEIQPAAATPEYPDATISDTDNKIDYGFYTGDEDVYVTTNNYKPETYDVAVKFDAAALYGTLIESITFPLQEVEGVSDISVFLTSQLRVENGKNVPDLVVKAVTPAEPGFITVKLDKPYTIPAEGVYVGYSLTVNDLSVRANATPITIINKNNKGGYYLHTSDGVLKWLDFGEFMNVSAMVQIKVAGKNVHNNAAAFVATDKQYVMTGKDFEVPVTLVNDGAQGIQSVDVKYTINGKSDTQHITAAVDGFMGKQTTVQLKVPAIAERGNYELKLQLEKVNDVKNEIYAEANIPIVVLNSVPKHRALLEEYTGTWCGWCPRGYVGLEKLAELYPDEYVLVSYHNGDDMEIMDSYSFPSSVGGFPDAWIDRIAETDAYYGQDYGAKDLGIADDLAERSKVFGQADVAITANLSEDGKSVNATASVKFPYDVTDGTFALEYILTADGLSNENWGQSNYYSDGYAGYPEYMDAFTKTSDGTIYGLVYNDVAVLMSQIGGIEGSIPASVTAEQAVKHSYTFQLADAVNTAGASVIQDDTKLKVVALLINTTTGEVVNANKVKVNGSTGISTLKDAETVNVVYYDLTGRRVQAPSNGIYIKSQQTRDGKVRTQKVLAK